jgi:heme-degrading monooxygenase HmoA
MMRFSRFRFRAGSEAEGLGILGRHTKAIASADGCEGVWLGQGQHPSTEFVVVALFRDEASLRAFEGRLRSDPDLGGDQFAAMRLTTQPPEMTQYEVRAPGEP